MEERNMTTKYSNTNKSLNNINIIRNGQDIFTQAFACIEGQHNGNSVIIPHVCNNTNLFSAGFAAQIAERFPSVKENFHLLGKKASLGNVQHILVAHNKAYGHKLYISNMIAQNGIRSPKNLRPINYGSLSRCMEDVKNFASQLVKQDDITKVQIHAPKFGSGLAGGDWNFIENLIEDIWTPMEVYIYLPNHNQK
jgi:hypothetical protein